jgi:hypoxanthine phosphoribosyltransferase
MEGDIDRVLLSDTQIRARVREMGREIAAAYQGAERGLTLVPVLSGAMIFVADLIRELPVKMKIALVQLSTYPGKSTLPTEPKTIMEVTGAVRGRDVLLVDDILDSGRTLRRVQGMLREHAAASVRTAVLLRKPGKAPTDIPIDFVGFDIDDLFVVGYGLDYGDHYRNYPHIGVLRPELTP